MTSNSIPEKSQDQETATEPPEKPGVRRIALGVEYDGSSYCGWQRQSHSPSVQEYLEKALSQVADQPVSLICAGRTDTGVHASGQVVHFETTAIRAEHSWLMGVNSNIDRSIALVWAKEIDMAFHARFSALSRTYRYIIANTRYRPAIMNQGLTWIRDPLDEQAMDSSLAKIRGERDFSSYRGAGCQSNSAFRCVQHTRVFRRGSLVIVEIQANAFLLHMVRNLVGTLLEVGRGNADENEMLRVLELKDRTRAGVTAPPYGLYLVKVGYPAHFLLPERPIGPAFLAE
ncbi:MAG: tRNA pseudouridine(38-40) synthase TruA [Porticoccaceae bacterium]